MDWLRGMDAMMPKLRTVRWSDNNYNNNNNNDVRCQCTRRVAHTKYNTGIIFLKKDADAEKCSYTCPDNNRRRCREN
jgi:hypothetical protein